VTITENSIRHTYIKCTSVRKTRHRHSNQGRGFRQIKPTNH